jgi:hypothetical protein
MYLTGTVLQFPKDDGLDCGTQGAAVSTPIYICRFSPEPTPEHEHYCYLCYLFDELPKATKKEQKRTLLPYILEQGSY